MAKRTKDLAESVDQGGQYHGVEENSNKDADRLVLNVINNDLDIDLTDVAIDYIHRAGDPKKKKKKKNLLNFMAPFYGRGSTAPRLEPLRGGSLLFTTKFPEVPGTHGKRLIL